MSTKNVTTLTEPLKENGEFDYQAFLYQWFCVQLQKFYIGYHTGFVGDGYTESSENDDFSKDRHNPDLDWEYSVIGFGTTEQMKNKERDVLKWHEARNNPDKFYNQTNGGSAYPHPSNMKIDELLNDISNGDYLQKDTLHRDNVDWEKLIQERMQCRLTDNIAGIEHVQEWLDSDGNSNNTKPITLLKDFYGDGHHRLLDGSTTILGMLGSEKGKELKYNLVPKEKYDGFTESDFEMSGASMNPNEKNKKWATSYDDWASILARAFITENRPINSAENRDRLTSLNYSSKAVAKIFTKARTLVTTGAVSKTNTTWKSYKDPIGKKELTDRIAAIEEIYDGKIKIFSFPSAKVRWEDCWAWMTENKRKPKKHQIRRTMMLIRHTTPEHYKTWMKSTLTTLPTQWAERCEDYELVNEGIEEMPRM